jgi:hypothetical protein
MIVFVRLYRQEARMLKAIQEASDKRGGLQKHSVIGMAHGNLAGEFESTAEAEKCFTKLKVCELIDHRRNGYVLLTDKGRQALAGEMGR